MKILVDTHTHTNCSTHAFSTIAENIGEAKKKGMEMICMTDHAPSLPDAPHIWHFNTMRHLPREIDGIKLMFGIEANIVDSQGNVDVPEEELRALDMAVASIHEPCYARRSSEEVTQTYLNVIKNNPLINIIGHSGNPKFTYDYETVICAAKEYNKCIEINNHSFGIRKGSDRNCMEIAKLCKKNGTRIVVSSDAHNCWQIGEFSKALAMLEEIDFPVELIMNTTSEKFTEYIKSARG